MIEDVTRKELLNVLKMMDEDIEKERTKYKSGEFPFRAVLSKFLNIYSRRYLVDIAVLEEQYWLFDVPF